MTHIGVISAIPSETQHLISLMEHMSETRIGNTAFYKGRLDDREITLVESGMGKVNAAFVTTLLLSHFQCQKLIFSGVAGGIDPNLDIGDIIIANSLIQHDYGYIINEKHTPYHPGHLHFLDPTERLGWTLDKDLEVKLKKVLQDIDLPEILTESTGGRIPQIHYGRILTGDTFLDCAKTRNNLYDRHKAQAIEMEGAAVFQIAEKFNAPTIIVRCLSDLAGAPAHLNIEEFITDAGAVAALVVRHLLQNIG